MIVFMSMFLLDYALTFAGIRLNVISEANPIMIWLFNLNFGYGILVRIAMCIVLLVPFYLLMKKERKVYNKVIKWVCTGYGLVFILHFRWILWAVQNNIIRL